MTAIRPRRAAALVAALALALTLMPAAPGSAGPPTPVPYLALGDSLPYGWDVVTQDITVDPDEHVGYPETLAARSPLTATNAACPGETSGSFIARPVQPDGCGFVAATVGLKVDWAGGSQLEFAEAFLAANQDTGLVSLQLGANDLFACQSGDDDNGDGVPECLPNEFLQVLATTQANLLTALTRIRGTGYDGPVALVAYYSLDYRDATQLGLAEASRSLLQGIAASGAFGDVVVADGFAAFEQASRRSGGDPCAAGLLLVEPDGSCDIHTSPAGDRVMAQALRRAIDLGGIVSTARSDG